MPEADRTSLAVQRLGRALLELGWFRSTVILVCVAMWAHQIFLLGAPIVGQHSWRQADTFSVAYNFHHESANFFLPRFDRNEGRSGIMAMEAPLVMYVTHLAMVVLGDSPQTARFVVWLLNMLGVAAGAVLIGRYGNRELGLFFLLMLALSPCALFELRQILPDGPSVWLALAAALFLHRSSRHACRSDFIIGVCLFALAALAKTPAVVLGPALWLFSISGRRHGWTDALARSVAVAAPIGLAFGWHAWGAHLTATYNEGVGYLSTSVPLETAVRNLQRPGAFTHIYAFLLPGYVTNWCLAPAVAVGLATSFSAQHRRLSIPFFVWLASVLALYGIISFRLLNHWYYGMLALPPVAYFGALGLAEAKRAFLSLIRPAPGAWPGGIVLLIFCLTLAVGGAWATGRDVVAAVNHTTWVTPLRLALWLAAIPAAYFSWRLRPPYVRRALATILAIGVITTGVRAIHDGREAVLYHAMLSDWRAFDQRWGSLRRTLDRISTRADLVVADLPNPKALYWAMRKGWADGPRLIETRGLAYYTDRRARFLVHIAGQRLVDSLHDAKPDAADQAWALYCIDPAGCAPVHDPPSAR